MKKLVLLGLLGFLGLTGCTMEVYDAPPPRRTEVIYVERRQPVFLFGYRHHHHHRHHRHH